jgi:hypothetical protein
MQIFFKFITVIFLKFIPEKLSFFIRLKKYFDIRAIKLIKNVKYLPTPRIGFTMLHLWSIYAHNFEAEGDQGAGQKNYLKLNPRIKNLI